MFQAPVAHAAIPTTLGYQGRLKNSSDVLQTGTFSFIFRLYSSSTGGVALWTETQPSVTVDVGVFAVDLGSVTPFPVSLDFTQPYYLTTEVNGTGEMTPRVPINSVPYAMTAGGVNVFSSQPVSATGGRMYYDNTNGSLNYFDQVAGIWKTLGNTSSSSIFAGLTWTNATGTNTTSTNLFATNLQATNGTISNLSFTNGTSTSWFGFNTASGTNLFASSIKVNGSAVCLANGTNCSTPTSTNLQAVTNNGNTTTNAIVFNGGTSTFDFVVSGGIKNILSAGQTYRVVSSTAIGAGPKNIFVAGKYLYVVSASANTMSIFDVTDVTEQAEIYLVSSIGVGASPSDIYVKGRYAYITNQSGNNMQIIDVSRPASPVIVSTIATGLGPTSDFVSGRYVYVTNSGSNTMSMIDVSDPLNPFTVSTIATGGNPSSLYIYRQFAYVTNMASNTISIIDVTTAASPSTLSTFAVGGSPSSIFVSSRFAYVANQASGTLSIVDVSDPGGPTLFGSVAVGTTPEQVFVSGRYAYVTNGGSNTMTVVDVEEADAPIVVATIPTEGHPYGLFISGLFAYVSNNSGNDFSVIKLNGIETVAIEGHSAELGSLQVRDNAFIDNQLIVGGGLAVGNGGILSDGPLAVSSVNTTSTFAFGMEAGFGAFASRLTLGGVSVCLSNGTNCPAGSSSLSQVTAVGATTTQTLQLFGGFLAASSTVTSTLTVLGSTSLQAVTFTNATGTSVTTTNLFATNGTVSNFLATNGTVTGLTWTNATGTNTTSTNLAVSSYARLPSNTQINNTAVCLLDGTNCPSGTSPNFQTVTNSGNTTTNAIVFNGGTSTGPFVVGNLTATGTTSLQGLTFTSATGTNTTTTNLFATNLQATNGTITTLSFTNGTSTSWFGFNTASGTTLNASAIFVNGSAVCLANGTNCPVAGSSTSTLADVTARGSFATSTLQLFGGFIGASSTVTSTFTVLGNTSLQGTTFTNTTSTNSTSTNLFATNGSFTNLSVTNPLTVSGIVWTSATGTNTTSTNFFVTNEIVTNSTITSLSFTNGTSTSWFGFNTASGSTLNASAIFVNGSAVCLANGTNCPSGTTPNFQTVTNTGNTTTNAIVFNGGTSTADFVVTGNLTTTGLTFTNATGTSVTTTNLFATNSTITNLSFTNGTSTSWFGFATASGTTLNASAVNASSVKVNGINVCLANGTNCPAPTVPSLAQVTAVGATTTQTLQLFGGFLAASSTVTSTLTVLGDTSLQGVTFTNATGTSVTSTNLFATNGTISNFLATNETVGGITWTNATGTNTTSTNLAILNYARLPSNTLINNTAVCLLDGTNCPSGTSPNFQTVTNSGNTTTNAIVFNGGTSTGAFNFQNNLTVSGTTALQDVTFTIATGTSVTTTNLFATNGTISNFLATNGTVTGLTWTNATGTNTTSTNLFATNLQATNGSITNLSFTNGTSTSWFGFATASGTTLNASAVFVNGSAVCLANGTNCPAATVPSLAQVTAVGATTTQTLQLFGGFLTASSTATSTFTVLGDTALQAVTFTNATGTNVTTTNLFAANGNFTNLLAQNATATNMSVTGTLYFTNATATIRMVTSGTLSIVDGLSNNLLQLKDLNVKFGAAINAGAFIDRNSTIQEEFNKFRTTIAADTSGAAGAAMGDGGGWGAYENLGAGCSISSLADTTNGIMRINATTAGTGCLVMMDEAANNIRAILQGANLPIILMKVKPSNVANVNHFMYIGAGDSTDGVVVAPTNFIGFANDGGSTWLGKTISGGTATTVTCTGQTISTTQYGLVMVEVRSATDVRFFVDPDVSNGISFTECGTGSQTNIPVINLAPELQWQVRAGGVAASTLDVDFYRAWQDDPKATDNYQPQPVLPNFSTQSGLTQAFPADDLNMPAGTLVSLDFSAGAMKVKPTDRLADSQMVGVVTNDPGLMLTNGTFDGARVVTHGRARVIVSAENGSIHPGDALTSASTTGAVMRATQAGPMIGRALEAYAPVDGAATGTILLLVQDGYYIPDLSNLSSYQFASGSSTSVASSIQPTGQTPEVTSPLDSRTLDGLSEGETLKVRDAIFGGRVTVKSQVYLGQDSVGEAKILSGATTVRVKFRERYQSQPIVTVTPLDFVEALYRVVDVADSGFSIQVNAAQSNDKTFNWHAFGNDGGKLSVSDGTTEDIKIVVSDDPSAASSASMNLYNPDASAEQILNNTVSTTSNTAVPESASEPIPGPVTEPASTEPASTEPASTEPASTEPATTTAP